MNHIHSFMSFLYKRNKRKMFMTRFSHYLNPSYTFYVILLYIMTTLSISNSQGKVLTYTNELIETILLQLNPSNNYYTTGDDDTLFIKIGSTKVLLLDYTYHVNRTIFQNYTINENTVNAYGLEFILNSTSNEYTLQGVYNGNSHIGSITDLSQVFFSDI